MKSADQIETPEITDYLSSFKNFGDVIDFKFFKVTGANSDREAHSLTAQKTLELLGQDNDNYLIKLQNLLVQTETLNLKLLTKLFLLTAE